MPLNVDKISTGSLSVNGNEINNSGLQTVAVDGVTIFGDGTLTNPLSASTSPSTSYKVYTALLNQSGTNPPTATVIENTLGGGILFGYNGAGNYTATFMGIGGFIVDKTVCFLQSTTTGGGVGVDLFIGLPSTIFFQTFNTAGSTTDNRLNNTPIEIRVYN